MNYCMDCILDGTDACSRGAGQAVDDEACEDYIEDEIERKLEWMEEQEYLEDKYGKEQENETDN